ncbi:MAG: helix-turn-helix transcriptional regulator [Bacteroidales bacterium]|nr:helix-turn-helix transcriptional regulator [Bacteroidales bacterium]
MTGKEMAKVFRALSSEQRLNLFKMIYYWQRTMPKSECCGVQKAFSRACDTMSLSRSTISHHLKELQLAGLIVCEREGQALVCSINEELVEEMKHFFD